MASSSWTLRTGNGSWSTSADWTPAPPAAGSDITIGNSLDTGNIIVTEDKSVTINSMTLKAASLGLYTTTLSLTPASILSVSGAIKLGTGTTINGTGSLIANGAITGGAIAASSGLLMLSGTGWIAGGGTALSIGSAVQSTLELNLSGGVTATPIAINSANQTLEIGAAGALAVNGVESITNGAIQLDGGQLIDGSGLVIGGGATLRGKGTVAAAVSGSGVVVASAGTLDLTRALSAGPSYWIDTAAGSTLRLDGSAATGTTFSFKGAVGTLELANAASARNFNGSIAGLTVGASATVPTNEINIQATATKATLSGSRITVLNGTTTIATLNLSSAPSLGSYAVVRADATLGGYDVFLSNAPQTVTWSPASAVGTEGRAIALGTLVPSGGNPLTSIVVSGIPVGAKLTDGTHAFTAAAGSTSVNVLGWNYASLAITPANDTNFVLSARLTDTFGNVSVAATDGMTVNPLAPVVKPVSVTGRAGQPIVLNLGVSASGLTGDANSLASVVIGGIPAGATLANTNHDPLAPVNGSVTFSAAQLAAGVLNGLSVTPTTSGTFHLSVAATEQDAEGGASTATVGIETVTVTTAPGRTISTAISGPVALAPADNPLTITTTGSVTSTGTSADGIDGATGTNWAISNSGSVISAAAFGISLASNGSVYNAGQISGNGAIRMRAGGNVVNAAGGSLSATGAVGGGFGVGAGVYISGASGSVTNQSNISGGAYGVAMAQGGTVSNASSITGGEDGVIIQGGFGTVNNSAAITATVDDGVGLFAGGSVINGVGASITGAGPSGGGVFITGGAGSVANSGKISEPDHFGILITAGSVGNIAAGTVSNTATGTILGSTAAVAFNGVAGAITNDGTISATGPAGADLEMGGTVTNNAGGAISGSNFAVFVTGGSGTVTNAGKLTGALSSGVDLAQGGSVSNQTGGFISGGQSGVFADKIGSATINNSGIIIATATTGAGTDLENGGTVANAAGASISGGSFGVFFTGASGAVTNDGSIAGMHGVGLQAGGSFINTANATVQGQSAGVFAQGAAATITNSGIIAAAAAGGAAADIEAGGTVTNNAGANLTGTAYGVFLTGGGTVNNAGTIGGASYAVKFGGSGTSNRLVVESGSILNGAVGGASGGINTLEFAGGTGTLSNVSGGSGTVTQGGQGWSFYGGWGAVAIDAGANWTFTGSNSLATVSNAGTVGIAGSLTVTSAIDPTSSGIFQLGSGATLETAAALGTATQIAFLGPSNLIADSFAAFGTNVGTSSYVGPDLQGFTAGDQIDLKDFSAAGVAAPVYDSSTGLLQISNGAAQTASLLFQTSSLGTGAFNAVSDGASGTLISLA